MSQLISLLWKWDLLAVSRRSERISSIRLLFVLCSFCFISVPVSGDSAQVLQLRLHLHLCHRGLAEARGLRLSALLQGQVGRRRPRLFSDAVSYCSWCLRWYFYRLCRYKNNLHTIWSLFHTCHYFAKINHKLFQFKLRSSVGLTPRPRRHF